MKRFIAIIVLTLVYGITWLIAMVLKLIRWPWISRAGPHHRIIVNGTFHNPNWFRAHITPLIESNYGEVILVCDEPVDHLPNLVYRCPPAWAARIMTRAGAKAVWTFYEGLRNPADVYIGYHIFPSAITVLLCARILGGKSIYQITSGPLELEGGGWHAENVVLTALGRPSKWIEYLAMLVVRQFDVAIVRGTSAASFIAEHGFQNQTEIVTGSVRTSAARAASKDIDIIFVGRLTEYKRPDRLLDVITLVAAELPEVKVAIVGDGPDRAALESRVRADGIETNVEFLGQRNDVLELMSRARIFVLTSRWEGVSIAMLEAMAMQAVPVVTRVGDLADFAIKDETGYVVEENQAATHASHLVSLLTDEDKLARLSRNARELVVERCDSDVLAKRWHDIFTGLTRRG